MQSDHDYADVPNIFHLSEYKKAAISYIAGFVAKLVEKQLLCMQSCNALGSKNLKDRERLFKPTQSVIKVCEEREKCFDRMLASTGGNLPQYTAKSPNCLFMHCV